MITFAPANRERRKAESFKQSELKIEIFKSLNFSIIKLKDTFLDILN